MMEAARNGLLPISVAFAAQKALQRKNPPPPPAQGTVMSDMLSQLQQSQNPREQGIAGLENPVMDNAQYAGGGIVAFSTGGITTLMEDPITGDVFEIDDKGKSTRLGKSYIDPMTGQKFVQTASGPRSINPKVPTTPPKPLSRLGKIAAGAKNVGNYDVKAGIKGLASKVTAGGVARTVGGGALTGGLFEGLDVLRGKEVPTEEMQKYYGVDPNAGPSDFSTFVTGAYGGGENAAQFLDDVGLRALGTGQRLLTMNLTGPERLEEPAAAAAKPKSEVAKIDPTGLSLDFNQTQQAAGGDRYAGIQLPSQATGIRAGYQAARDAVGPTDEASVGDEQSFIDKQAKIDEKYEIDKPLKAQQGKITERRAKLDEDYSKSMLTDLGLAFLTKGVMAAGEGKDTFSAMAYAVGEGAKTTKERRERIDQIREKLDDRESMLETQLATMRQNQVTRGLSAREKELSIIRQNSDKIMALSLEETKSLLAESGRQQDAALRVTLARIAASGDADKISAVEQLSREYVAYSRNPNRQKEAAYILQRIAELESTSPAYQAAAAKLAQEEKERAALGGAAPAGGGTWGKSTVVNQ
jgi:hypothetical protein